jgi:hypothetical protein
MANIALKSALMLTTRVIQIINPELHLHMQRTALIALELAQASGSRQQQQTIFAPRCCTTLAFWAINERSPR